MEALFRLKTHNHYTKTSLYTELIIRAFHNNCFRQLKKSIITLH